MAGKAFLVDTSKCQGCRGCQVACKQWNGLPAEKTEFFGGSEYTNPAELSAITWNHVVFFPLDRRDPKKPVWTIMHKKCFHCAAANCLRVCPEKAIYKKDGWTVIDQSRCIGCGACVNACIYKVPHLAEANHVSDTGLKIIHKDKSHKCNACTLNERDIPACVKTCPSGSLLYGSRQEMIKIALKRVEELKREFPNASVYGLNEFGGLGVITVLRDKPERFGLPVNVKAIDMAEAEAIKDTYALLSHFTFGIPFMKKQVYKVSKALSSHKTPKEA
jgi:formate dehydrogenase iron-sulfur subunit